MKKRQISNNMLKNLINKKIYAVILISTIIIYIYFRSGITSLPVENLNIPSGVGFDISEKGNELIDYCIPISSYNYGDESKISGMVNIGKGNSIAETRGNRQLVTNKKMVLGVERVLIISEEYARFGIENILGVMFKNSKINDTALMAVCEGKAEDILKYKVPKYPSAADFIAGLLKRTNEYNFFTGKYECMDTYRIVREEGKNLVLPYIEIDNDNLKITGMALFKKEKMIRKINVQKSKTMNMLRENKVRGMIILQESPDNYISYYATTKRKVRCEKNKENFTFFIDLSLNGTIIENNLFPDIHENKTTMRKFQSEMIEKVKRDNYDFIKEMQNVYKIDCLELGRVAAAKYGRDSGVDWDEVVSNSEINVSVDVKVSGMGRGEY